MGVVTLGGFVFHVGGVNRDPTGFFFGGRVNLRVIAKLTKILCNGRGQRGFSMVNVTDGADVNVGFVPFKFCLCHGVSYLFR